MRLFLILLFACAQLFSVQVSDLTYEKLVASGYTDHVQHFQKLFQHHKVRSFIEFGLGYGTKYFLDNCEQVTSVEILLPSQSRYWADHTISLLQGYTNWTPIVRNGSQNLQTANSLAAVEYKDPALYDSSYLLELKEICNELFRDKEYEVAFVDPGFHMRGDLVNELFDRVPIIVAHDTNYAHLQYGWNKIYTPSNYVKIVCTEGSGTTFWIRTDEPDLIRALGGIVPDMAAKKLRVLFPMMHTTLVKSMALVLQHLGHILVLPGESFDPRASSLGPKISYVGFLKKKPLESTCFTDQFSKDNPRYYAFLENVELIENDEIFSNPPDVLVVNCEQVEQSIYSLFKALKERGAAHTKLVHYSGNNGTRYDPAMVKNFIAVDAYSAKFHDPAKTNIVFWIPWIDFETLTFDGCSDTPIINSYLGGYYSAGQFQGGAELFKEIVKASKKSFPGLQIHSLAHLSQDQMFAHIEQSTATLHLKESDGFGYTILESMAKGRPVFLKKSYSKGSRLMYWCIQDKTAFFIDDYRGFKYQLRRYLDDKEFRHQMQTSSAQLARELVNNEKQARILEHFLQNLIE